MFGFMDKEKAIWRYKVRGKIDPEGSLLSNSIEERLMKNSQEESVIEALEQLIDLGEEHGQVRLTDIFQLIPHAEEDEGLFEDIHEMLLSMDIQIIKDGNQSEEVEEIIAINLGADQEIEIDEDQLKEELQNEAADVGDTIGLYLSQVSKVPLLDREEEIDLAKRIERGREASEELAKDVRSAKKRSILKHLVEDGLAAREHLLLANVRLVFSVAKKYSGRGIPILDLVQEGHIGLMRATKKYEYQRGHKFSTYATWWIRQAVSRYVADQGRTIRLPVHMGDRINKMLRTRHRIIQELGHEPTPEELAQELNESLADVEDMLKYAQRVVSLDLPVSDDDDTTLADFIENDETPDPEELTTQQLLSEHVNELLTHLPPREALILRLRFGLSGGRSHTLNEIGNKLGITRERVRQIETQARNRIRRHGLQDQLKEYLQD
jgi:RNA polymerase primary sigma factor